MGSPGGLCFQGLVHRPHKNGRTPPPFLPGPGLDPAPWSWSFLQGPGLKQPYELYFPAAWGKLSFPSPARSWYESERWGILETGALTLLLVHRAPALWAQPGPRGPVPSLMLPAQAPLSGWPCLVLHAAVRGGHCASCRRGVRGLCVCLASRFQ